MIKRKETKIHGENFKENESPKKKQKVTIKLFGEKNKKIIREYGKKKCGNGGRDEPDKAGIKTEIRRKVTKKKEKK